MASVSIDPSLVEAVVGAQIPAWLQRVLTPIASEAFANCPQGTPDPYGRNVHVPLRYTINTRIDGSGSTSVGVCFAASPHAFFVHEGTQGGQVIVPKGNYPLRFYWSKSGKNPTFRRSVVRGATPANPFLRNALVTVISSLPGVT